MRSVRTTFQILDAVADNQPVGLSELARRMGLPKSTVQRSLATLAEIGWIRPEAPESSRWTLGDRVRALSEKIDDVSHLRDAAAPALDALNAETLETIHLAVAEPPRMRLIERRDSRNPLRFVQPIGARSPMHATSTGKSVLAFYPEADVEAYIKGGLEVETSHTITDADAMLAELKAVRSRGYAIANQEHIVGVVSVAASIRPGEGRPIGAISISGPSSRITPDLHDSYGELVMKAAAEISARLRS